MAKYMYVVKLSAVSRLSQAPKKLFSLGRIPTSPCIYSVEDSLHRHFVGWVVDSSARAGSSAT